MAAEIRSMASVIKGKDAGVLFVLLKRFETQRLPRAQQLKAKVDNGGLLNDTDLAFLKKVQEDARHIRPLVSKHPKWQPIAKQAAALYKEITEKGLANQEAAKVNKR